MNRIPDGHDDRWGVLEAEALLGALLHVAEAVPDLAPPVLGTARG
jgi:hypothetical protein